MKEVISVEQHGPERFKIRTDFIMHGYLDIDWEELVTADNLKNVLTEGFEPAGDLYAELRSSGNGSIRLDVHRKSEIEAERLLSSDCELRFGHPIREDWIGQRLSVYVREPESTE